METTTGPLLLGSKSQTHKDIAAGIWKIVLMGKVNHLAMPAPLHSALYMAGGMVAWGRETAASLQKLSGF